MRDLDDTLANEHEQSRLAREAASQHQKNFEKSKELRKAALQAAVQAKVDAADQKGFDEGYDKATVEYQNQVREIVGDYYAERFRAGVK